MQPPSVVGNKIKKPFLVEEPTLTEILALNRMPHELKVQMENFNNQGSEAKKDMDKLSQKLGMTMNSQTFHQKQKSITESIIQRNLGTENEI